MPRFEDLEDAGLRVVISDSNQDALSTPAQRIYWRDSQEFRRQHQYINQLRLAISASNTDMNNVFINGSAYSPPLL